MAYVMSFFAGEYEKILPNIESGKVSHPAYVFVRDNIDSTTGRLAFIDKNNEVKFIRGENKQVIVRVDVLPSIENADSEVIYIVAGKTAYVFDGEQFNSLGNDHTAEIEALTTKVVELEDRIDTSEHLYERLQYEIADTPEGTLIDYRDSEIRIMCPVNAVFTKQSVGAGGDANSYYMTFKTFAPSDDAVGYIEHLGDKVDSEILTDIKTDNYGRRYQPTWLALANYDESTNTWSYYGEKSTTEKYIGWDYQIDWYNADSVMIASDCIRINLSNEECHSVIEPSYVGNMTSEINTLKETNVLLEEQVAELAEVVETLKASNLTFVELE